GSDYVAASGTLSFAPGVTSRTVTVAVNGDTVPELDEDFFLNLSSPTNASLADGQARATIKNDDAYTGTLSIADAETTEGNSGTKSLSFTVTLSQASTVPVSVTYATANGTATAGQDYSAVAGTRTFPAGTTTRTIAVSILGDTTVEPDETFKVTLSNPVGATLSRAQATGTIRNDDSAPPPQGAVPVVWTSPVGVTVSGNSLTKSASVGWGNAGAVSVQQIASGDGYVEFTASATTRSRVVGLSRRHTDSTSAAGGFGTYRTEAGWQKANEKGAYVGAFGTYAAGDRRRGAVVGGVVKYSRNGVVFYSSKNAPAYPLLVDTALYTQGAT